mgnify:CR=1 FL=1
MWNQSLQVKHHSYFHILTKVHLKHDYFSLLLQVWLKNRVWGDAFNYNEYENLPSPLKNQSYQTLFLNQTCNKSLK